MEEGKTMGNTARIEILEHRNRWEIHSPFGQSWSSSTFHGPDHLVPIAINQFKINNKGEYDDCVVLVQSGTGWF